MMSTRIAFSHVLVSSSISEFFYALQTFLSRTKLVSELLKDL